MTPPFIDQAIRDLEAAQQRLVEAQTLISHTARMLGIGGAGSISPAVIGRLDGASHDLSHAMDDVVATRRGLIASWHGEKGELPG